MYTAQMGSLHSYEVNFLKNISTGLKIPQNLNIWSKDLPAGSIFLSPDPQEDVPKVRPTWGKDVYFCDAGDTLTILALEKSGEIRAVVYKNVDNPHNQNTWAISNELPVKQARELFIAVHRNFEKRQERILRLSDKVQEKRKNPGLRILKKKTADRQDAA